jgi:hypothetical protein
MEKSTPDSMATDTTAEVTTIHSLPPELIQITFMIYVQSLYLAYPSPKIMRGIMSVTHVCRRWREISLAFPQMWFPVIQFQSNKWRLPYLFLQRGGSSPLRMSNLLTHPQVLLTPLLLREHADRLHEITIRTGAESYQKFFEKVGHKFENLLVLNLACEQGFDWMQAQNNDVFDAGRVQTPELRHLALDKVWIRSISQFRELRSLSLRRIRNDSLTVEDLVSFLSNNPQLEDVEVDDTQVTNVTQHNILDEIIHLPRLRKLRLLLDNSHLIPLFRLFSLKGCLTTHITIGHFTTSTIDPFIEACAAYITLFDHPDHNLSLAFTGEALIIKSSMSPNCSVGFSLVATLGHLPIIDHLNLWRVTHLRLACEYTRFMMSLPTFPNATNLALRYRDSYHPKSYGDLLQNDEAMSTLCPRLHELEIVCTDAFFPIMESRVWLQTLSRRREAAEGVGLKRLTLAVLEPGDFDAEIIAKFEALVDDFRLVSSYERIFSCFH